MGLPDDAAEARGTGRAIQLVLDAGRELLDKAQPTHDAVLTSALKNASELPELSPLVDALGKLTLAV